MRLAGRMEPGSGAGPVGHVFIARTPARMVAAYEVASCFPRPGINLMFVVSAPANIRDFAVESEAAVVSPTAAPPPAPPAPDATSPLAVGGFEDLLESAFAFALPAHPATDIAQAKADTSTTARCAMEFIFR